ncbi:beta-glucosidase 44-like [Tasmannia lanceolata]|uniref:beta-glucosidase 44-like n=1 Tax=Tasmannia lanceolata TaxID=3420 RepID=UPI0040637D7D
MVDMNVDAYRFSISWSRIFPDGVGRINKKGVHYYNNLINYILKKGITPYVTLVHYDIPEALERKFGGLLNQKIVKAYASYTDFCFKTFGDRVKNWMTFNEPHVVAQQGYDLGIMAPARCSKPFGHCHAGNSLTEPYIVAHNLLLSHAAAVHRYRHKYQKKQKGRIGIVLDFLWYEPLTNKPSDIAAAKRARDFNLGWFLHPIVCGEYPKSMQKIVRERLPKFTKREIKILKGSIDFVGINHYTTYYAYDHRENQIPTDYIGDWNVGIVYERNGVPIGPKAHSDWLYIVPWGMHKAVNYVKEKYDNPTIIITENGMDTAANLSLKESLHDWTRINFYRGYLKNLKKAIDDGANVVGYFAWSLIDNFEWLSGYTSRFGLHYIDYNNGLRRVPKMSAHWFRQLLYRKHHG